jgi:antitoxin MazE
MPQSEQRYTPSQLSILLSLINGSYLFVDKLRVDEMKARVQKWGNSLALRIPKSFATAVHLTQDSLVDISLVDGKFLIAPIIEQKLTLEQLLEGVTEENIHSEVEIRSVIGNEIW